MDAGPSGSTSQWPALSKAWGGALRLLYGRPVLVVGSVFVASVALTLWFVYDHQSRLIETQALQQARAHSQALSEFRTLYTATVVATAQAHGLDVTHDFASRENAIPLPATLSMLLGDSITARGGGRVRLYSAYPFPWRRAEGGLRDAFEREAWDSVRSNPEAPFYRVLADDGRQVLRYATADLMRPSCVNCHNTHADTPKDDWKEGDVRGILEVEVPLDAALGQLRFGIGGTFAFLSLMAGLGLSALVLIVRRSARVIFGLRKRVTQLGQYTLDEQIGAGGMGVVYKASHAMLRRPTAVKLLPLERAGEQNLRRFEREVQFTSQLSHPSTIVIYDYGRTPDGEFYYAMEYVDGITLSRLVAKDGSQREARVIHVLMQACGSLAEAHAAGHVHRDIKPSNLMLCERGGVQDVVKVLDFGLVRELQPAADVSLADSDSFTGTPLYLPPEAIKGPGLVDQQSDLYQLGAVAYFLITGQHVFTGDSVVEICGHHLHTLPELPSERLGRTVAADLEELILQCLEKEKSHRPAGAAALREALAGCEDAGKWSQEDADAWWTQWRQRRLGSESWHVDFDKLPESGEELAAPTLEVDLKKRVGTKR